MMTNIIKNNTIRLLTALLAAGGIHAFAQPPGGGPGSDTSDAVTDAIELRAYEPTEVPDRVTLTICGDPSTQMAVNWRTCSTNAAYSTNILAGTAVTEITLASGSPELEDDTNIVRTIVSGTELETDDYTSWHHAAVFEGLQPGTKYVYRVGNDILNGSGEAETMWSEWNHFTTAASGTSSTVTPFSFVYFGDAQNGVKSHWSRVIREAYSDLPDAEFFLHAGDLINTADNDQEWGEWFYAGGWINAMVPQVATPGNHEYDGGAVTAHWRPHFTFPENGPTNSSLNVAETVYYFDYQGTRFISLDSEIMSSDSATNAALAQAAWLTGVLEDNPNKWTIVYHHRPVWPAGEGRSQHPFLETYFKPIYETYGVDLVLQGHDHTYARGDNLGTGLSYYQSDNGPVYVVSVAGEKMYESDAAWADVSGQDTQLYQLIEMSDDMISYGAYSADGEPYDAFRITKTYSPASTNTVVMGDIVMQAADGVISLDLQLQQRTNLTKGSWTEVGDPVSWEMPADDSPEVFYRVKTSK